MNNELFRTPDEEITQLLEEINGMKQVIRDISGKLGRIEKRLKVSFPSAVTTKVTMAKKKTGASPKVRQEPSITPEEAKSRYEQWVELEHDQQTAVIQHELSELSLPNLLLTARELGLSLGSKKPSMKVLSGLILNRIRQSAMLTWHSNITRPDSAQHDESAVEQQE